MQGAQHRSFEMLQRQRGHSGEQIPTREQQPLCWLLAASTAAAQAQGHSSIVGMFACRGSGAAEHAFCACTGCAQLARMLLNGGLWAGGGGGHGARGRGEKGAGTWMRRGEDKGAGRETGAGQIMRITAISLYFGKLGAPRQLQEARSALPLRHCRRRRCEAARAGRPTSGPSTCARALLSAPLPRARAI